MNQNVFRFGYQALSQQFGLEVEQSDVEQDSPFE